MNPRTFSLLIFLKLLMIVPLSATAGISVTYTHTDVQGSVVALTDEDANVVERREYEPYGLPSEPIDEEPGYTGHVHDSDSGLVYMQQRYYDPVVGRFLSVDPVGVSGANGGNFNRYWYANNNPTSFEDPDGRCTGSRLTNSDGLCQMGGGTSVGISGDGGMTRGMQAADAASRINAATELASNSISKARGDVIVDSRTEQTLRNAASKLSDPRSPTEEYFRVLSDGSTTTPTSEGCTQDHCDAVLSRKDKILAHSHVNQGDSVQTLGREFPGPGDHLVVQDIGVAAAIYTPRGAIHVIENIGGSIQMRTIRSGNRQIDRVVNDAWRPGMSHRDIGIIVRRELQ